MLGRELRQVLVPPSLGPRRVLFVAGFVALAAAGCRTDPDSGDGGATSEQTESGTAGGETSGGDAEESDAATTGGAGPDLGICALLLECVRATGDLPVTPLVGAYGEDGTCWDMFDAADCHADCRAQLGTLAMVGNECADCLESSDCPDGQTCSDEGVCLECTTDLDCEPPFVCGDDGSCGDGAPCERFTDCNAGQGCYESTVVGVDGKVCGQPSPDAGQRDDACESDFECEFDLICVPGLDGRSCQIECGDGLPSCPDPMVCLPTDPGYCATLE